jgi:hypothetical protein
VGSFHEQGGAVDIVSSSNSNALTDYEAVALREFIDTNDGDIDRLTADEQLQLLDLLDRAGVRRWWGLRLRGPAEQPGLKAL